MICRLLPESLHWLVVKERNTRVAQWVTRAEKLTGTQVDVYQCMRDKSGGGE